MDPSTSVRRLDSIIERYYELNRASNRPKEEAQEFANLLHWRLKSQALFGRDCRVDIYGSMKNGLWTYSSDVDICVRLEKDNVDIDNQGMKKYLKQIRSVVDGLKCDRVDLVMCNTPVVKFSENEDGSGFHGDICFLNEMAIYNSNLLQAYSKWDQRFVKLGLLLKKWVSICQIGSGQAEYPSSYAWIIMLIQFLQNTEPKVLPNLQLDFIDEDENIHNIKKGHNIYFHKKIQPNWSNNVKTVGKLFIDFFDYYSKFDFLNQMVQIHSSEPVSKPPSMKIVFLDPITHEKRGCVNEEKARYISKIIFPKSYEAFSSAGLETEVDFSLIDLDKVLREYKITKIGETFEEIKKAKKAEARKEQLAIEKAKKELKAAKLAASKKKAESDPIAPSKSQVGLPLQEESLTVDATNREPVTQEDDLSPTKAPPVKKLAKNRRAKKNKTISENTVH